MRTVFTAIVSALLATAMAAMAASAATGFTVGLSGGPGRAPEVLPGDSYRQGIVVTAGDQETEVLIEVLGYRQDVENGVIPLAPYEDVGPNSGRTFISPEKTTIHLDAGETKKLELDVSVPQDVGDGGRYALLRFSTRPGGEGTVGIVSAIVLPFRFTIKGSRLVHTGRIAAVEIPTPESGNPLKAVINYENTGNHHYDVSGQVLVKSLDGALIFASAVAAASPIPGSTSQISTELRPDGVLQAGRYSAEVNLVLDDGTLLDKASATFQVPVKYAAPPNPKSAPVSRDSTSPSPSKETRASNVTAIVALAAGAFALGCLGTLLATKRRRSH
jgi:hypothetical protein